MYNWNNILGMAKLLCWLTGLRASEVGVSKWKQRNCSHPSQNIKPKIILYTIDTAKINVTQKDLKNGDLVVTIMSLHSPLFWPLQKTARSWKMTVNDQNLKQLVASIGSDVLDTESLLKQIKMSLGVL